MRIIILTLSLFVSQIVICQISNGTYRGLIEMCNLDNNGENNCFTDSEHPDYRWFHLTYIKIADDSVFIDMLPIVVTQKNDTLYSASDGGFYFYKGKIIRIQTKFQIHAFEVFCDYCPELVEKDNNGNLIQKRRSLGLTGSFKDGIILINGYSFRATEMRYMDSEHYKPEE